MSCDWRELLDRALDGEELSPQEAESLREGLSDPRRLDDATAQVRLYLALYEELSGASADEAARSRHRLMSRIREMEQSGIASTVQSRERRTRARLTRVLLPLAAAGLVVAVVGVVMWTARGGRVSASGDVRILRAGAQMAATDLRAGDTVVAEEAGGEVLFGKHCRLSLASRAELVVRDRGRMPEVELLSGTLTARIAPGRGSFTCRTPLGTVRTLGTRFVVTVGHSDSSYRDKPMTRLTTVTVVVLAGAVAFDLAGRSGTLGAGESRTFAAAPADGEVARLAIFGTGAPAGTVALFGHGFAKGEVKPADRLVMRRLDTRAPLRTQANAVTSWPDGSIKVALLAVEAPALEKDAVLECALVKDPSSAVGESLDLASLLKNRSATLTIRPKEGQPWTFDLLAGARQSKDRWHSGPLAVSTRVETKVPPEHVGGVTSLRLVADVIATGDGILEIDWRLANDALRKVGGGPAVYAYDAKIDGQEVYTQAEARHIQYSAWVRARGRSAGGPMPQRPLIRPDYDVLVRGGFTLPWDRALPPATGTYKQFVTSVIEQWAPRANEPYPAWGITRDAGQVGGRQEIGYRTYAGMLWIKTGDPAAQFLAQRQCEVGMSRPQNFWDEERGTWVTLEDWPRFTSGAGWAISCPLDVPREKANGLPTEQKITANSREHVTVDHAHNADYWSVVALLSGRRMAFDGLAMNAAWEPVDQNARHRRIADGKPVLGDPDYRTGTDWAPGVGVTQVRSFAWALRGVALAAALLPDNYPRREYYNRNALAYINSYGTSLESLRAERGELAGWVAHTNLKTHTSGFMNSFVIYAVLDAVNLGVAGEYGPAVLEYLSSFRVNAFNTPDFNWRNAASGRDIRIGDGTKLFTKWSEVQAAHREAHEKNPKGFHDTAPDWPGNMHIGDWQPNVLAGLALLRDAALPLEMRAKAADGMVLFRSERQHGPEGMPRIRPPAFFGEFEQLNSLCPHGSTWRWDIPPVVRENQSFRMTADTPVGTIIGLVITDGALPRASKPEGNDAFVIVEQPAGNPFAISRGGALKTAGKVPVGTHIIRLYATTWDENEKEHRGPIVDVKVECVGTK